MARVLIIEDDPYILELTMAHLTDEGFKVVGVTSGESGLAMLEEHEPDLVILDVNLPHVSGFEVCRHIRAMKKEASFQRQRLGSTPIILLTARAQIQDKLLGLDLGADDYLVKPFEPDELTARARAVLRRVISGDGEIIRCGQIEIQPASHEVFLAGQILELSPTEFDLLLFLTRHPERLFTRYELLRDVWGYSRKVETRIVDIYINRLRSKLAGHPNGKVRITTVRGVGYRLEVSG